MADIKIAVINESTEVSDGQVAAVVAALQVQVNRDFAPVWGADADLRQVADRAAAAPGEWWLVMLDDSDQAGALGYHDLTSEGLPLGKVFARTTRLEGGNWTVTASHELLEMLGDPDIDLTVLVQDSSNGAGQGGAQNVSQKAAQNAGRLYAYEVCDACEDDSFAYPVNGISLSDFVYPAWFETFRTPGSTQFDFQKQITKPLELLKGGYIGYLDMTGVSGWQQLTAAKAFDYKARPRVGSRRERRRTPRSEWMRSETRSASTVAAKAVGGGRREVVRPPAMPVATVARPFESAMPVAAAPAATPVVAAAPAAAAAPPAVFAAAPAAAPPAIDVAFEINTIWPAANAAYNIMSDPNPLLPAGYALVGAIVAQTQNAALAMAAGAMNQPNQLRMAQQMMADSNVFGLVAFNAAAQTAIVSIRGTQTVLDWIEDVDAVPVPFIAVPDAGFVHMGFQIVYEHIRPAIDALLMKVPAAKRILVTGHSLGAAVAVMAAVDIAKNVRLGIVPELHTLAGPRSGAPDFASYVDKLIPVCHRIVNFGDIVPQVPVPPVYEHVGDETVVHGGFRVLDPVYAHHLTTYLAGLQQLAH